MLGEEINFKLYYPYNIIIYYRYIDIYRYIDTNFPINYCFTLFVFHYNECWLKLWRIKNTFFAFLPESGRKKHGYKNSFFRLMTSWSSLSVLQFAHFLMHSLIPQNK